MFRAQRVQGGGASWPRLHSQWGMRVLVALQATPRCKLPGGRQEGGGGREESLAGPRPGERRSGLAEGLPQRGHLSSYTPVSEAAPGLLTPGSSGPSLRTHGTSRGLSSRTFRGPWGHLPLHPLGQQPHGVTESKASELCPLPVAVGITTEGRG